MFGHKSLAAPRKGKGKGPGTAQRGNVRPRPSNEVRDQGNMAVTKFVLFCFNIQIWPNST